MTTLDKYLKSNTIPINERRIDEVLLTLVAGSILAYCCKPLLETDAMKSLFGGIGMMFGGIGSLFKRDKDDNDKKDKREVEELQNQVKYKELQAKLAKLDKDGDEEEITEIKKQQKDLIKDAPKPTDEEQNAYYQNLLNLSEELINKEKDSEKKKKFTKLLEDLKSCTVDENGKMLGLKEIGEEFKKLTGGNPKKYLEDLNVDIEGVDFEDVTDQINTKLCDTKKEDLAKTAEEGVKEGQKLLEYRKKEDKDPEKDDEGNVVKDEEIKDPETGKKIKVKTHTGPRGGKFYYPDGKPKTPENRVYVKESLSEYLKIISNN